MSNLIDSIYIKNTDNFTANQLLAIDILKYYSNNLLKVNSTLSYKSFRANFILVNYLVENDLWNKIDEIGTFSTQDFPACFIKLKHTSLSPNTLVNYNYVSGDFDFNFGLYSPPDNYKSYKKYLDTGYSLRDNNIKVNDYHYSIYIPSKFVNTVNDCCYMGVDGGQSDDYRYYFVQKSDSKKNILKSIYSRGGLGKVNVTYDSPQKSGFICTSSTIDNIARLYHNGKFVAEDSIPIELKDTYPIPEHTIFLNAINFKGKNRFIANNTISFYTIGKGLTPIESYKLHFAVQNFERNLKRHI